MGELKKHQSPMTVEEQIDNLKSIVLIVNNEIKTNSKAPFVRNFRENYVGGELPIYALVEVFSFGTLSKTPILYKEYSNAGIGNNRIFGVLLCLKHLLKKDDHWKLFVERVELLFEKYENVSYKDHGISG